jgi:hypothetical protein
MVLQTHMLVEATRMLEMGSLTVELLECYDRLVEPRRLASVEQCVFPLQLLLMKGYFLN